MPTTESQPNATRPVATADQAPLTDQQRKTLRAKLADDLCSAASEDRGFLRQIVMTGFTGLDTMTDAELLKCHLDAFDEPFEQ